MTANVLIKGGRIIDPSQSVDEISDLLVTNGVITEIKTSLDKPRNSEVFDAEGKIVCPGFIDLHCHLREPGEEYKETIETGTAAAAAR
ncbi:MAG TPA: dihydroorotase, partial [Dehalococcoidia bacterium]|nr:dihydroorotase [Dehalococcoidia bacterium]